MKRFIFLILCFFPTALFAQSNSVVLVRQEGGSIGSGVFISENRVLTCYHVLSESVTNGVNLRIEYRNNIYPVEILSFSKEDDLALLKVEEVKNVEYIGIGENLEIGDLTKTYGHPHGSWTVHSCPSILVSEDYYDCMEANVLEGMSGGPVIKDNKLVGIVSAKSAYPKLHGYKSFNVPLRRIRAFLRR